MQRKACFSFSYRIVSIRAASVCRAALHRWQICGRGGRGRGLRLAGHILSKSYPPLSLLFLLHSAPLCLPLYFPHSSLASFYPQYCFGSEIVRPFRIRPLFLTLLHSQLHYATLPYASSSPTIQTYTFNTRTNLLPRLLQYTILIFTKRNT